MAQVLVRGILLLIVLAGVAASLVYFMAWRSPETFAIWEDGQDLYPLMSWEEYGDAAAEIIPPYLLQIDPLNEGAVYLFGAVHALPTDDPQYRLIQKTWNEFEPTVAMIEGRLGFLLPQLMDPTERYGESGFVASLARQNGVPLYSWELSKEEEIVTLKKTHTPEQVALFIILRPYWGSVQNIRLPGVDKIVESLIKDRGKRAGIEGLITSIEDIDRIWARDFPEADDWRDQQFGTSLPGYAGELFVRANDVRDFHMLNSIMALTRKGERVYVSAGWSHVLRIQPVFIPTTGSDAEAAE